MTNNPMQEKYQKIISAEFGETAWENIRELELSLEELKDILEAWGYDFNEERFCYEPMTLKTPKCIKKIKLK